MIFLLHGKYIILMSDWCITPETFQLLCFHIFAVASTYFIHAIVIVVMSHYHSINDDDDDEIAVLQGSPHQYGTIE